MPISARNKLPGKIAEIHLGDVVSRVVVKVGKNTIESVITRASVEELNLKKGDEVRVVVKSTEVMLRRINRADRCPASQARDRSSADPSGFFRPSGSRESDQVGALLSAELEFGDHAALIRIETFASVIGLSAGTIGLGNPRGRCQTYSDSFDAAQSVA